MAVGGDAVSMAREGWEEREASKDESRRGAEVFTEVQVQWSYRSAMRTRVDRSGAGLGWVSREID